MKKTFLHFGTALLLLLAATAAHAAESAKEAVNSFLTSSVSGTPEKTYSYFASSIKEQLPFEDYKQFDEQSRHPVLQAIVTSMKFNILDAKENGDTAVVKVEQDIPDIERIMPALADILNENQNIENEADAAEAIKKHFNGEFPFKKHTFDYELVKENGEWKIIPPDITGVFTEAMQ